MVTSVCYYCKAQVGYAAIDRGIPSQARVKPGTVQPITNPFSPLEYSTVHAGCMQRYSGTIQSFYLLLTLSVCLPDGLIGCDNDAGALCRPTHEQGSLGTGSAGPSSASFESAHFNLLQRSAVPVFSDTFMLQCEVGPETATISTHCTARTSIIRCTIHAV